MRLSLPRFLALSGAALLLFGQVYFLRDFHIREGDTRALVAGVEAAQHCLAEGRLWACPDVGPYPLFQHVVALALLRQGLRPDEAIFWMSRVNLLALYATLLTGLVTLRRLGLRWAPPVWWVVVTASPLLYYSVSSMNEMTAAFLTAAFASAVLLRASGWLLALALFLAGTTKELAPPLLVVLGLAAGWPAILRCAAERRRILGGLGGGALLSIVANIALNLFRYGKPQNVRYLWEAQHGPDLGHALGFFAGMWVSPGAGLLFFWPVLVCALVPVAWTAVGRGRDLHEERLPAVALLGLLACLTAAFASWWSPFGWWSWGPRLIVPWLPAVVLVAMSTCRQAFVAILGRVARRPARAVLLGGILALASLANVLVLGDVQAVVWGHFALDEGCPREVKIEDTDLVYSCLDHQTWKKTPMFYRAWQTVPRAGRGTWTLAAGLVLSFLGCLPLAGALVARRPVIGAPPTASTTAPLQPG